MRAYDRDLIRGGHYGQRSCEPHSKAEHMAAPTQTCHVRFSLPTRSRPHMARSDVSLRCQSSVAIGAIADIGRASRTCRSDAIDPQETCAALNCCCAKWTVSPISPVAFPCCNQLLV